MSKFTDFFKKHPLTKHICYMLLVALLLIIVVLIWLMSYTNHGEKQIVPDVVGLRVESAANLLEGKGLLYEVVDSIYSDAVPNGAIVDQNPSAGDAVKKERKVYLTINAVLEEVVPLPDVVDISLRQATTILESSRIGVADVVLKPSEYKNLVLAVFVGDTQLLAGDMVKAGSSVVLHVGSGSLEELSDSTNIGGVIEEESLEEEISF